MFGREDITPYVHMNDAELSAGQAFWMSLIVTELVANALKHSLAREEGGSIWIDLRRLRRQEVELTVSDSSSTRSQSPPLSKKTPTSWPREACSIAKSITWRNRPPRWSRRSSRACRASVPTRSDRILSIESPDRAKLQDADATRVKIEGTSGGSFSNLNGKHVLVTGASSGLGRHFA